MKTMCTFIIISLWTGISAVTALAQTGDARLLTREGFELSNQKNYAAAIEKYRAALTADPNYAPGIYQMAFALSATGKGLDGIPYLQRVFRATDASVNLISGAYDLAGSIYDQNHQLQKAIDIYKEGVAANPKYQPLQFNLGLAYFRNKQYAEAEATAIEAIKLDPKYTGSMRLYALVCFHQNKRAAALLGFCSFLILEPNTIRSAEAYGNIQHILQGGALKPEPGVNLPAETKAIANAQNQIITKVVASFANRKYASSADLLNAELKAIFTNLSGMKSDKYNYWHGMADYFNKLAQTPNMPAFARLVSLSIPESAKWAKANPQAMTDLDNWIKGTERELL